MLKSKIEISSWYEDLGARPQLPTAAAGLVDRLNGSARRRGVSVEQRRDTQHRHAGLAHVKHGAHLALKPYRLRLWALGPTPMPWGSPRRL